LLLDHSKMQFSHTLNINFSKNAPYEFLIPFLAGGRTFYQDPLPKSRDFYFPYPQGSV